LCLQLLAAGAVVNAFDPAVKQLPSELAAVTLAADLAAALAGSDAAVVCTEWPAFRDAPWPELVHALRQPVIIDANRFLEAQLKSLPGVKHLSVGRAEESTRE
jgi:UDPglucose 6-dehydrogenase